MGLRGSSRARTTTSEMRIAASVTTEAVKRSISRRAPFPPSLPFAAVVDCRLPAVSSRPGRGAESVSRAVGPPLSTTILASKPGRTRAGHPPAAAEPAGWRGAV